MSNVICFGTGSSRVHLLGTQHTAQMFCFSTGQLKWSATMKKLTLTVHNRRLKPLRKEFARHHGDLSFNYSSTVDRAGSLFCRAIWAIGKHIKALAGRRMWSDGASNWHGAQFPAGLGCSVRTAAPRPRTKGCLLKVKMLRCLGMRL